MSDLRVLAPIPTALLLLWSGPSAALASSPSPSPNPSPRQSPLPAEGATGDKVTGDKVTDEREAMTALYRERLARGFAQRARSMLQREYVFLGMLQTGRALMEDAVALDPDNPFLWRLVLDFAASIEEGDDGAAELASRAIGRILELEPDDEVMMLRRLLDAINRRQTAEERIAAFERLLSPESIDRIGPMVAARLAFDYAVLLRRTGDLAGFGRELLRAVELDPFFPEATEVAAGYFRVDAPGPVEEARALRAALLANPLRESAAIDLADLCLRNGAYQAASEVLEVLADVGRTEAADRGYDALLSRLVVALWGSGRPADAVTVVRRRQDGLNALLRAQFERQESAIPLSERKSMNYPISTSLAGAYAALARSSGPEAGEAQLKSAGDSTEVEVELLVRSGAEPEEVASVALEGAMLQLWLGGDVERAKSWIAKAESVASLSSDARARFDGLLALRTGDAVKAREILAPIAERDLPARLGLADALEKLGDRKGAAQQYLAVARASAGTAFGLWSRERLATLVGQKVEVVKDAAAVEEAARLPAEFMRVLRSSEDALLLRARPREADRAPWDPMVFDIELTNRSGWPLAITPDGPLLDTATVTVAVNVPGGRPSLPPLALVSIHRRFAIQPGESLVVPVELSLTDANPAMREDPISGAFVSIHPIINWRTTETGLEPGPLGREIESPIVHVRGERVNAAWVGESLAALRDPSKLPDPETIASLLALVVRDHRDPLAYPEEVRALIRQVPEAVEAAVPRLPPEARAWLVFAAPKGRQKELTIDASEIASIGTSDDPAASVDTSSSAPSLERVDALLRSDPHPLVRKAWISVRCRRPEDSILDETIAMPDPALVRFATEFRSWMSDLQEERRRRLNLTP